MKNFADKLVDAIIEKKSVVDVGLDPRLEQIPSFLKEEAVKEFGEGFEAAGSAFFEFNKRIIDAVESQIPAIKPQIAFYEQYGKAGIEAFDKTVKYGQKRKLLVIADGKRNDIGSTAKAYAAAHLGEVDFAEGKKPCFDADCLTVNAYLGTDGVKPFTEACKQFGKGIFVLVKTSNPSSGDIQDKELKDGGTVFELMAEFVKKWGAEIIGEKGYSSVGAVVGATYSKQAKSLRKIIPQAFFLVPGYGAQGGGAKDVLPCFNDDGLGAIVNSSRGIIFAYEKEEFNCKETEFEKASLKAVEKMNKDINSVLKENSKLPW